MLMMARRQGETILIGNDIEIVIAHIGRSRVKVGIRAPRALAVLAQEVKLVGEENAAAAGTPSTALWEALVNCWPAHTSLPPADEGIVRQDAGAKH